MLRKKAAQVRRVRKAEEESHNKFFAVQRAREGETIRHFSLPMLLARRCVVKRRIAQQCRTLWLETCYWYGAKMTFAALMCTNTLAGSYIAGHSGWFYAHLGLPAVVTLSFFKAVSYSSIWPLFWSWAAVRWLFWSHRPCMIGHEGRTRVLSFRWKYNRHGLVPHCIPGHDLIVANLNPHSDYRSWPEYLGLRTPLIEQPCDCGNNVFCARCIGEQK